MVGTNKTAPSRPGARKEASRGSSGDTRPTGGMVNTIRKDAAQEPTQGTSHSTQGSVSGPVVTAVTADGRPCREFRALIDGAPAHLLTDKGCWPITRVYFDGERFDLGDGNGRSIGGESIRSMVFTTDGGLQLVTSGGYHIFVGANVVKACWRCV